MATPKPGEIRCPTCHRSTVPAAFCTQCGSPIPGGAVARPRGLDREELQDRIRARRSGDDPYRRGEPAGGTGAAAAGAGAYQRYQPEPGDAAARASDQAVESQRIDNYREASPRPDAIAEPPPPDQRSYDEPDDVPLVAPPPYVPPRSEAAAAAPRIDNYDDESYEIDEDLYYADDEPRGPGAGPLVILVILAIGVLALLGGAFLGGFLGGDEDGVGSNQSSPTQSVIASPVETPAPSTTTPLPSASPSGPADSSSQPSEGPRVFPDGFVAEAQPCAAEPTSSDCGSSGAVNNGTVYILVSFKNGTAADVIGVNVVTAAGEPVGGGDIPLRQINCAASCAGWTYFRFIELEAGEYKVNVTRNGEPAGSTGFRSEP